MERKSEGSGMAVGSFSVRDGEEMPDHSIQNEGDAYYEE